MILMTELIPSESAIPRRMIVAAVRSTAPISPVIGDLQAAIVNLDANPPVVEEIVPLSLAGARVEAAFDRFDGSRYALGYTNSYFLPASLVPDALAGIYDGDAGICSPLGAGGPYNLSPVWVTGLSSGSAAPPSAFDTEMNFSGVFVPPWQYQKNRGLVVRVELDGDWTTPEYWIPSSVTPDGFGGFYVGVIIEAKTNPRGSNSWFLAVHVTDANGNLRFDIGDLRGSSVDGCGKCVYPQGRNSGYIRSDGKFVWTSTDFDYRLDPASGQSRFGATGGQTEFLYDPRTGDLTVVVTYLDGTRSTIYSGSAGGYGWARYPPYTPPPNPSFRSGSQIPPELLPISEEDR